jgi:hypothetical protein
VIAVEESCDGDEIRLSAGGKYECFNRQDAEAVQEKCSVTCGSENVEGMDMFGVCQCSKYVEFEEVCDDNCQFNLPTFACNGDGSYTLGAQNEAGDQELYIFPSCLGINAPSCSANTLVNPASSGASGKPAKGIIKDKPYFEEMCRCTIDESTLICNEDAPGVAGRRRRRTDALETKSISSPIMCITEGASISFEANFDNMTTIPNFLVYDSTNLMNSNPDFAYGIFEEQARILTTTEKTVGVTALLVPFNNEGFYVFHDNLDPSSKMYVLVLPAAKACPSSILASSSETLAKWTTPNTIEDMPALMPVVIALAAAFGITLVLLVLLKVMAVKKEKSDNVLKAQVAKQGKVVPTGIAAVDYKLTYLEGATEAPIDEAPVLLEEFGVKRFYDMLGELNSHVSLELDKHTDELREFYSRIGDQSETLKKMIRDKSNVRASPMDRARNAAQATKGGAGRDKELVDLVKNLLEAQWDKASAYTPPSNADFIEEDEDDEPDDGLSRILDKQREAAARAALMAEKEAALREQALKNKRAARLAAKRAAKGLIGGPGDGDAADSTEPANIDDAIADAKKAFEEAGLVFDPSGIFKAADLAERRRVLQEARDKLTAKQSLDAKLRNRLAAKLKALEVHAEREAHHEEVVEAVQELAEAGVDVEGLLPEVEEGASKVTYDPSGVLGAAEAADRRRRLQEARSKLEAHSDMEAKLKNRLAARLKELE